jgi:hypothetical protein
VSLYLTGTFSCKDAAIQAIRQLEESGYGPEDLTVFSDEPVEFPRGVLDRPSHMSLAVVSGAATFFVLVVSFVYFTQYNYRLVTGGMPIFSFWPTSVIFYEMTMLGAILTTFGWFIWESGLFRRDGSIPIPAIEPEVICLRVRYSPDQFEKASAILREAGAASVVRLEKAA